MRRFRDRVAAVPLALILTLAVGGSVSHADESPSVPEQFPAADQFVESIPTSRGPRAPRVDSDNAVPLPPAISGRLHGPTGAKLRQIATSETLGAPQQKLPDDRVEEPGLPAAAVSAAIAEEGNGLLGLLLALLVVTAVLVGTARHRRYGKRDARADPD